MVTIQALRVPMMKCRALVGWLVLTASVSSVGQAAVAPASDPQADIPVATFANVSYGPESRQGLDFWKAAGDKPRPVVIFFHGGSWKSGSRNQIKGKLGCSIGFGLNEFLAAGVSVVSVDYRLIGDAVKANVIPPVRWPLLDAARAVQFVRSKAAEWNVDKTRIAFSGESAGACTALWLALHDDLADRESSDPVLRESTRPLCAGVVNAQTSLDPRQVREWFDSPDVYGGHAFGFDKLPGETAEERFARMDAARDQLLPWLKEYSPMELASSDDPPICFYNGHRPPGKIPHGALYGVKMKERLDALGVECQTIHPGTAGTTDLNHIAFLIRKLIAK